MAIILNIDTALETGCISLAQKGQPLLTVYSAHQRDHAAWIQVAIQDLMTEAVLAMEQLDAIGVDIGPGSYTGVRIGLSTAKGICYALKIPLIIETSLKQLGFSALKYAETSAHRHSPHEMLFCPMIDARRMEVFTAVYDSNLQEVLKPQACIVKESSFEELLRRQKILFLGNGSMKFQPICQNPNAVFENIPLNPVALSSLTYKSFIGNNFADLTYANPLYLKEFFTKQ